MKLISLSRSFPTHFNETLMFSGGFESLKLKSTFREKFRNISKIMDCVGCDKCRLWGKLQVIDSTESMSMPIVQLSIFGEPYIVDITTSASDS